MASLKYIYAGLILTFLTAANTPHECTECPEEINPVCIGDSCAAVCEGESCEVHQKEICRLHNQLGKQGRLQRVNPTPDNGICYYKNEGTDHIPFHIEK